MKALLATLLIVLLTGCGATGSIINSSQTDYVILSHSKAGGMYKLITGETEACKMSKHGVTGLKYKMTLKDGACEIEAAK